MPRKVRELIQDLKKHNFQEVTGGKLGDDAKLYQEKQIQQAIEEVSE